MRTLVPAIALIVTAAAGPLSAQSPPSQSPSVQSPSAPRGTDHPREVAFVGEGAKGFVYRRFPTGERLYTYDRDSPGQSHCNAGCMSAWPPVIAAAGAEEVGDWTLVTRLDGKRQWALRGKPVYTRFHDSPDIATGDGIEGVWHLVGYVGAAQASN